MKRWLITILCLFVTAYAFAGRGSTPYQGSPFKGFSLTVVDTDIDAAWEMVTSDTGYTALVSADSIAVAYSWMSQYDSLVAGNGPNVEAVWSLSSTADATTNNRFLTPSAGTPAFATAVFSNGFSYTAASPYLHDYDISVALGTDPFAVSGWVKSPSATNPSAVQTVFSMAKTPDYFDIEFNTSGKIVATFTDDGNATTDVITGTTDIYDGNWHHINIERRTNTIYLTVDGVDDANGALTNAAGSLDPDSAWVNSARGSTPFQGMLDEVYLLTETRGQEWCAYEYKRGQAPDTALVKIRGITNSDTVYTGETDTLTMTAAVVSDSVYMAYAYTWADSAENQPLITWSAGSTPRQAKIDSIPANLRHYPAAHIYFGKGEEGVIDRVIYSNYGANAITYQLRAYRLLDGPIDFTRDYDVKCPAYIASGGDPAIFDFGPDGLYIGPQTWIAVWALGGSANAQGAVTITGRRSIR